jgi:hypothetical protein
MLDDELDHDVWSSTVLRPAPRPQPRSIVPTSRCNQITKRWFTLFSPDPKIPPSPTAAAVLLELADQTFTSSSSSLVSGTISPVSGTISPVSGTISSNPVSTVEVIKSKTRQEKKKKKKEVPTVGIEPTRQWRLPVAVAVPVAVEPRPTRVTMNGAARRARLLCKRSR